MNCELAVALFIFRRPELTARVFAAIREARPSKLFLIADGPREGNAGESLLVQETRLVVSSIDWECEVFRLYSDSNLGLRDRVISGLDYVFSNVTAAVVLEDDCLPSISFFRFSAEMLVLYENEPTVGMISGNYFGDRFPSSASYGFDHDALIWGWATWGGYWREFRQSFDSLRASDVSSLLPEIKESFSTSHRFKQFGSSLRKAHKLDSWALYFAAFVRLNRSLVVRPRANLVENIGFGVASTHTHFEAFDVHREARDLAFPLSHPERLFASAALERSEERAKLVRWLKFPVTRPLEFLNRINRFLELRRATTKQNASGRSSRKGHDVRSRW